MTMLQHQTTDAGGTHGGINRMDMLVSFERWFDRFVSLQNLSTVIRCMLSTQQQKDLTIICVLSHKRTLIKCINVFSTASCILHRP